MHEKKLPDLMLIFIVMTLIVIGLIMILSASSIKAQDYYGDNFYFFKNQIKYLIIGLLFMFLAFKIDYNIIKRAAPLIILFALLLLAVVLIPSIGKTVGGSRRWLSLGPISGQPSEFAKLAVIIYLAAYFDSENNDIKNFLKGLLPPLVIIGIIFFLILLEPDLGTAVMIAAISLVIIFAAGIKYRHLFVLGVIAGPMLFYFVYSKPYRWERMLAFIDPWKDPLDTGYHIIQSLLALGSGGIFGVGPGGSHQKFLYLPEPGTDFIFAVLGEEFGLIGTFIVLVLFFLFAWRGLKIAVNAQDVFSSLLAVGITSFIVLQAVLNIGVATAALPVTGITLPFISYGGSSLVIILISIGLLLNVSRYTKK
ncbi:MAG: putative lipid II flippase FtsW [Bacillota bacterium]